MRFACLSVLGHSAAGPRAIAAPSTRAYAVQPRLFRSGRPARIAPRWRASAPAITCIRAWPRGPHALTSPCCSSWALNSSWIRRCVASWPMKPRISAWRSLLLGRQLAGGVAHRVDEELLAGRKAHRERMEEGAEEGVGIAPVAREGGLQVDQRAAYGQVGHVGSSSSSVAQCRLAPMLGAVVRRGPPDG